MNAFIKKVEPEEDENGYDNLCKYSIEKCELCDMVFSSRFANIIHSSQHIIIPLLNHKIHTCKKCLYCYTSKSELKAHKQAKHKKKDINEENDGQFGHEGRQIVHERSQIGHEGSQLSYVKSEISHNEGQIIIDQNKSATGKKKSQISLKGSQNISHNESQNEHKKRQNSHNEIKNEKGDLLQSIITKQPIVKIDDIANIVAKSLLATKNDEKLAKIQTDNNKFQKDTPKIQKGRKNIEKDMKTNESFDTKEADKQKTSIEKYSNSQTSQNNITDELIPTKIIIGGKKRKSLNKTDYNESKRDKKPTSTGTNENERDGKSKAKITNGIHTDLTIEPTNRQTFVYKEDSPDVISIKSDSSDEHRSDNLIFEPVKSKRSIFEITYDDEEEKNQPKTVLENNQSKNLAERDQSKYLTERDQSKNLKKQLTIPLVITDSDNELDENINELLLINNITSPVKKTSFRSKIQFEDDENLQLLELERELTNLSYEFKSVHYDDLVEPEMSECKRCHMIFMNRLALYKHETTHMRFRRTRRHYFCKYCENYYCGNHLTQKRHYENVHNTSVDKKKVFSCPVCKLQYYKLKMHYKKYHPNLICNDCSTCFGSLHVYKQHNCAKSVQVFIDTKQSQKQYDLLLVCDLCLSFIKTTGNFKYEVMGEKCEVGTRQKCFYCTKEFFDVKIVKRINFMTSTKIQNLKNSDGKTSEGKRKMQGSNAAKLLMIRKRLKAMKK